MIITSLRPLRSFSSYSGIRKLATIQCLVLLQPHHLSFPYPLSIASLDTHGNGIAESSWLTDYYNNSCRYRLCDNHDARAMLACFGVLLLLLLRSGDRFQVGSLG